MTRPKSYFDALRQDLHQVYDGDPWHGSSITSVLEGIDSDVASRTAARWHSWQRIVLVVPPTPEQVSKFSLAHVAGAPHK